MDLGHDSTLPTVLPRGGVYPYQGSRSIMTASVSGQIDPQDIVVLVVEDNELLRQIVGQVLHGLGLRDVRYVRSAADGLRAFAAQPAHLVIVEFGRDCQAADDMLRALAQSPACAHGRIGLIALAPEPNRERVIKAHDAGAEAVVAEPIAPKELADHVAAIIRRHQDNWTSPAVRAGSLSAADA